MSFPDADWSYSGNPASSPKDEVRFLTGDTNPNDPLIHDSEIRYVLTLINGANVPASGNYLAAIACVESIIGKFARSGDKSVGDLHISHSQRVGQLQQLVMALRRRATIAAVPMYVGGMSITEKEAVLANPDQITTAVRINGMNEQSPFLADNNQTTIP